VNASDNGTFAGPERFAAHESLTLDVSDVAAATVVLWADAPARVRVVDGRERCIDLGAAERRRVGLDVAAAKATVVADDGGVVVDRLVTVAAPPSAP
jgi:hypothetical protein